MYLVAALIDGEVAEVAPEGQVLAGAEGSSEPVARAKQSQSLLLSSLHCNLNINNM